MDLVKETEDPSTDTNREDRRPPPALRPSSTRGLNNHSSFSPGSCNHAFNTRVQSVGQSCPNCGLDIGDAESHSVPGPVVNGQDRMSLSREQAGASSHDGSHNMWDADFGTILINGYTRSATLPTRSTASRTMIVSQIDESEGDSVDMPVGDSSQPLLASYRPRQLPPSATMASHGLDNSHYQPLSQGPSPWSPYHLYRADVARRALENVELHQLSEDPSSRETPGPERDLDLGD